MYFRWCLNQFFRERVDRRDKVAKLSCDQFWRRLRETLSLERESLPPLAILLDAQCETQHHKHSLARMFCTKNG